MLQLFDEAILDGIPSKPLKYQINVENVPTSIIIPCLVVYLVIIPCH